EWGVTNGSLLDTPAACQDLVDHVAPPGYFSELRHMQNDEFLQQYNVNLARQVAMGSQLRLRFEQEAKLLKKSVAQRYVILETPGPVKKKLPCEEKEEMPDNMPNARCWLCTPC
nr:transposase (putative), gypsy type [Tanacetum cinerariifolium]